MNIDVIQGIVGRLEILQIKFTVPENFPEHSNLII